MTVSQLETAFCWRDGKIGFASRLPKGAMLLFRGPSEKLRDLLSTKSRHAYDGVTLLVPGVPEAENEGEAFKAVCRFRAWVRKSPSAEGMK